MTGTLHLNAGLNIVATGPDVGEFARERQAVELLMTTCICEHDVIDYSPPSGNLWCAGNRIMANLRHCRND